MAFSRGYLTLCAALAIALALPAGGFAAEGEKLKLSCVEGRLLSLEAQAALAPDVFQALERECGLILRGGENIPDRPVTATYEKVTLEERDYRVPHPPGRPAEHPAGHSLLGSAQAGGPGHREGDSQEGGHAVAPPAGSQSLSTQAG